MGDEGQARMCADGGNNRTDSPVSVVPTGFSRVFDDRAPSFVGVLDVSISNPDVYWVIFSEK